MDLSVHRLTYGAASTITIENFANVDGSYGNDQIVGDSQANRLNGYFGSDVLSGGDGNDILVTNDSDVLTGGQGADQFVFEGSWVTQSSRGNVSFRPIQQVSFVTDFMSGSDQLVLGDGAGVPIGEDSGLDFQGFFGLSVQPGTNTLDPSQFVILGSGVVSDQTRIIYDGSTGDLFVRGPSVPTFVNDGQAKFATLQNAPMLRAQDIIVL